MCDGGGSDADDDDDGESSSSSSSNSSNGSTDSLLDRYNRWAQIWLSHFILIFSSSLSSFMSNNTWWNIFPLNSDKRLDEV